MRKELKATCFYSSKVFAELYFGERARRQARKYDYRSEIFEHF
ncbi:hypothetical protein [Pontibacter ummariensis]|nr:hypothetical protein [Pontibacter ummariensis]